ncbi:(2Fe-2S)-binding protein [Oscillibacter sp. MSJ-2]|uniref:(2Fe-2S)-binding protein n=1 Tax=Dysosmobacter acutus TaxID=2841504 RepID=A0ABS6FBH5_9FIRM|nr:(2Fe-2S)-binding protein [Dysosmobacter acutus]MBU5627448.1 (2Fe-2S)-binding protein [Dysosmobacter acutus]
MRDIVLTINEREYPVQVEDHEVLVDVIRNRLHLYGTKIGCGSGECGACSIIMDGDIVNSCLILACRAQGHRFTTIEGLEQDGKLHPLQEVFIKNSALQCGFCGPGMLLAAKVLVEENPCPSEAEIRAGIGGNLCRCTGYVNIVKSVMEYAAENGGSGA